MKQLKIIFLCLIWCLFTLTVLADDISVEATVSENELSLGNAAQLVITVQGSQKVEAVDLPKFDGFETRYVGPQTQVTIINGNYSASKSFVYTLFPNKTGQFTIPAIDVAVENQHFKTQPIVMKVKDSSSGLNDNSSNSTRNLDIATSLKDKILLIMGTSTKNIYVGEQIPLTIKLMYSGVTISEIQYPVFESIGFTKEEFAQPNQSQQVINGVNYNVVDFKTFVSPTRTGELTLGPAKIEANLVYRRGNQSELMNSGVDLFDNLFNSYEKRVVTASSQLLNVHVLPLPDEGKPEDFSGAVGHFEFQATATPSEVHVGDPITLRMTITGDGNLKGITFPKFEHPDFKVYDPQIKDEGSTKVIEQVVIPMSEKVVSVPSVKFSYFDSEHKLYKTIVQGPFDIKVNPVEKGEEFKVVGFEPTALRVPEQEALGKDIVFIKEKLGTLQHNGVYIYQSAWFWLLIFFYMCALFLVWWFYQHQNRLKTDERFARRYKAPKQAREGLRLAQTYLKEGKAKEFYSVIIKTLTEYLGNHLHMPSGSITFDAIEPILVKRHIDDKVIRSIKTIFEAADMVRFGLVQMDEGHMPKTFESLNTILEYLEGRL